MSIEDVHPFKVVMDSSLAEFFDFYSDVSGTPLIRLNSLTFHATFDVPIVIRKAGGDSAWRRLKRVIPALFKEAVHEDRDGATEWEVMVRGESSNTAL